MSLVSCRNLFVSYEENVAVSDLSFEIKEQDYIFILGENGSGKSTLLKTILGLKAKKRGEIVLENLKRSEIGYLPQKVLIQKNAHPKRNFVQDEHYMSAVPPDLL